MLDVKNYLFNFAYVWGRILKGNVSSSQQNLFNFGVMFLKHIKLQTIAEISLFMQYRIYILFVVLRIILIIMFITSG